MTIELDQISEILVDEQSDHIYLMLALETPVSFSIYLKGKKKNNVALTKEFNFRTKSLSNDESHPLVNYWNTRQQLCIKGKKFYKVAFETYKQ